MGRGLVAGLPGGLLPPLHHFSAILLLPQSHAQRGEANDESAHFT